MEIYVVRPGDTAESIAKEQNAPLSAIADLNQLEYPYRLAEGQALLIPGGSSDRQKQPIWTGGYAYPFISPWVLRQTLPYLTELLVFSYGFTEEGDLIAPSLDDTWMLEEAAAAGVRTALTLTPLGEGGYFNNRLVTALTGSRQARRNLTRNLLAVLEEKGYQGVNVDFEYVRAEDRDAFTDFVAETARRLHPWGYYVTAALAPKYADDQPGLLYEGMDYRGLGQAADRVLLMTYEWGYAYGPPMAVAPLPQVRRVAEYALARIPAEKILLGVPNYGYDWTLPYVQGGPRARTLGNVEAAQMAAACGTSIVFDPTARSPRFQYRKNGAEHQVWFEDVRSWGAKLELVRELGFSGIGVWQINQLFRAGWEWITDLAEAETI